MLSHTSVSETFEGFSINLRTMAPSCYSYGGTPLSISFSGSGFLATYQLGVAQCFLTCAPWIPRTAPCVLGASAGSLVAAAVVCEINLIAIRDEMISFAKQLKSFTLGPLNPSVNMLHWLEDVLGKHIPPDAHHLSTGRLAIAVTRLTDGKQVVISEYQSKEDVVQALLCSCFVPGYCGFHPPSFRGVHYLDGGFSGMQPTLPVSTTRTLTVCPFSGEIDICPADPPCLMDLMATGITLKGNMANSVRILNALYPMALETLEEAFSDGYKDAIQFLQCHGLAPYRIAQQMFKEPQNYNHTKTVMSLEVKEEEEERRKADDDSTALPSLNLSGSGTTEKDVSENTPVKELLLPEEVNSALPGYVGSFLSMFGFLAKILTYLIYPLLCFYTILQNRHRLDFLFRFEFLLLTWHNLRHCTFFFLNTLVQSITKNIKDRVMLIVLPLQWIIVQTRYDTPRRHRNSSPRKEPPSKSQEVQCSNLQKPFIFPSRHYKKTGFQRMLKAHQAEM